MVTVSAAGYPPGVARVSTLLESTTTLLRKAREGDEHARDRLLARYRPALLRWARGRTPAPIRSLVDTDDLVQLTLTGALGSLDRFESRYAGAFGSYLRVILRNKINDQLRHLAGRPAMERLQEDLPYEAPSPLDGLIWRETLEIYEAALEQLDDLDREAFVSRFELGFTYDEVARAIDSPSANAARMRSTRALYRVADSMRKQYLHKNRPARQRSRTQRHSPSTTSRKPHQNENDYDL